MLSKLSLRGGVHYLSVNIFSKTLACNNSKPSASRSKVTSSLPFELVINRTAPFCLTETYLVSTIPSTNLFDATEKQVFRADHSLFVWCGVMIACNSGLSCDQLVFDFETFTVEVIIAVQISNLRHFF